jgi:hypothetical protein
MSAARTPTTAAAAFAYHARGWKPVPVSRKTKKPIGNAWQQTPFAPEQVNGNAQNVGIQLGAVSGGLVDIDLDSQLAIGLAPHFLPPTAAVFGRHSKACSHQLYISDLHETEKRAAIRFQNGTGTIVEVRIGGGKGAHTVFPPSIHTSGEMVQWVHDGEPAQIAGADLVRSATKLAIACVLIGAYPEGGLRHDAALALGGVLARAGWNADEIAHLATEVARAAEDDEIEDRAAAAASAVEAKANRGITSGLPKFAKLWGDDAAKSLGRWLHQQTQGTRGQSSDAGFEDAVALDFAEQQEKHFRYVAAAGQWMRWTGTYWQIEPTLQAFDIARGLCRNAGNADAKKVAAVTTLARADRRVAATTEQWDSNLYLFNTED